MIAKEFLDMLVCPVCRTALAEGADGASLKCSQCRRVYPVRDEIPILLVDEATIDPS
ncbi:MAG: Trm112 family protein [Acidobacteria bacterium]|nr:Trm112 family protein [Acidobacteriota bacterium]